MKNIFIAGASSGVGRALAEEHIMGEDTVFAVGQHEPKSLISHPNFSFFPIDLYDADMVRDSLRDFVIGRQFDRVILNAAIYPEVSDMVDTTLDILRYVMNVNVWSHKHIIDAILSHTQTGQIVALSASSQFFNQPGMGAYAISKAALNAMIELYAKEYPYVHFSAVAPGLIQTRTFSAFLQEGDSKRYPTIQRIRDSFIFPLNQETHRLMDALENVKQIKSGSFVEMKKLTRQNFNG